MTEKAQRGKLIAAIHATRKQVAGLDEEATWRAFLAHHGTTSLRTMMEAQLRAVLARLRASLPKEARNDRATPQQLAKLAALGRERGWGDGGDALADDRLLAFVRRTAKVSHPRFLTRKAATDCITGLEQWTL